jgi:glycine cleavage system transcriptional repressor
MSDTLLVSIVCPDRPGLISAITGLLFDLGINLGDASFTVLGKGSEFTAVCETPAALTSKALTEQLRKLPELETADISVAPFKWGTGRGGLEKITHRIVVQGHDQPGLVTRLTEVFRDYGANIVRMDTKTLPVEASREYLIELAVFIPASRAAACLAAVGNTAAALAMHSSWSEVEGKK